MLGNLLARVEEDADVGYGEDSVIIVGLRGQVNDGVNNACLWRLV